MEQAEQNLPPGRRTILFIDEIHRFNKSQQDALLPFVESGLVTFIGATTENPSFEVNSALLSRAQVYVLQALSDDELRTLAARAQERVLTHLQFDDAAVDTLVGYADGDARRLLNLLEQADTAARAAGIADSRFGVPAGRADAERAPLRQGRRQFLRPDLRAAQVGARLRSRRGAVLAVPHARRRRGCRSTCRAASCAWPGKTSAWPIRARCRSPTMPRPTYERLGSPEGELALAQAVIYLAVAPKSNAGYMAYNQARAFIRKDRSREVPVHLRNAPTKLMKELGHGKAYRYAHDEPEGYAAGETYLPDGMPHPAGIGRCAQGARARIAEKLRHLRQLDDEAGRALEPRPALPVDWLAAVPRALSRSAPGTRCGFPRPARSVRRRARR